MARHADVRDDSQFYEDAPAIRSKPRKSRQHVQQQPRAYAKPDERIAARLDEWCGAYNISEVHVYRLINAGLGPKLTRRGALTFVTREDWYDWWKTDIPPKIGRGRQNRKRARLAPATAATQK
jgi:hypothetical protein